MLRKIQDFIRFAFCLDVKPMTVERWAEKNSKLVKPEEIITARIIQMIAKDFDDWALVTKGQSQNWPSFSEFYSKYPTVQHHHVDRMLVNRQRLVNVKSVVIFYEHRYAATRIDGLDAVIAHRYFNVNSVPLDPELGKQIVAAYVKIKLQREEAERVAAKALKEQQENEAKWNLAENLLGMKRNEFGALVPEKEVACSQSTELTNSSDTTAARPSQRRRSARQATSCLEAPRTPSTGIRRTRQSTPSTVFPG
jgi:hypothetical protein